jgi:hypothetical protein
MARERRQTPANEWMGDEAGEIEQRLAEDSIDVPPFVELSDGALVYSDYRLNPRRAARIRSRGRPAAGGVNAARRVSEESLQQWAEQRGARPGRGLLLGFCKLAVADDQRILAFARRWGPLYLCEHELPFTHHSELVPFSPGMWLHDDFPGVACRPLGWDGNSGWEPTEGWRRIARAADAMLQIGWRMHQGEVADDAVWKLALDLPGAGYGIPTRVANIQKTLITRLADWWLVMGRVRPTIFETGRGPIIRATGQGLFGVVATQIMLFVAQSRGWAHCKGCGRFKSPKRRPAIGRAWYCDRCRARKLPVRDAERAMRARRALRKHARSRGETEVKAPVPPRAEKAEGETSRRAQRRRTTRRTDDRSPPRRRSK